VNVRFLGIGTKTNVLHAISLTCYD